MRKQTFIIEFTDPQVNSWQGSIEWMQGQKKRTFESVRELFQLVEPVVADKKADWVRQFAEKEG